MAKDTIREIVIPGEVIVSGDDFLPGEGTEKQGKNIVAMKYGLAEE
jgi:exosome complex RNA-binding protein Csl4